MENTIVGQKIIMQHCLDAAHTASTFIKKELYKVRKEDIQEKALNSLVSYVDKEAEKLIVSKLRQLDLDAGFITEEGTIDYYNPQSEFHWVIDPLDGTTNYLKRIPHFSVSIALEKRGQPIIGVVKDVMKEETFSAILGGGAKLNGELLSLKEISGLSDAILGTGFPYENTLPLESKFKVLAHWLQNSRGIRRMGSAALDLAYVAAGRLDSYYEGHLNRWDLSAGSLIAAEAGAIVSDFSGGGSFLDSGEIVASNPVIHDEVIGVLDGLLN